MIDSSPDQWKPSINLRTVQTNYQQGSEEAVYQNNRTVDKCLGYGIAPWLGWI